MNDFENAYLRVPKALFFCGTYADLSAGAKLLYALLDDRNRLSQKNGWVDFRGKPYLYYSNSEIARMLGICEKSRYSDTSFYNSSMVPQPFRYCQWQLRTA